IVARIVLDPELLAAQFLRQPVRPFQGREARMKTGDGPIHGKQVLVPPQTLGTPRDGLACDLSLHAVIVVLDLVGPKARLAHVDRRNRDAMAAFLALQAENVTHSQSAGRWQQAADSKLEPDGSSAASRLLPAACSPMKKASSYPR